MTINIKVPQLPDSVSDATIVTWYVKPGESIKKGANLVDLETDKVVLEVPAPEDGVLENVLKAQGSTVVADEVIAHFKAGASAAAIPAPVKTAASVVLSPAVKRMVGEHQVDPSTLQGTGRGGKLQKRMCKRLYNPKLRLWLRLLLRICLWVIAWKNAFP